MSVHHVEARGMLERRITPVVLLLPTPRSEQIAIDLGFANRSAMLDLLRPLMFLREDVHLQVGRDASDIRLVVVPRYSVRLHTAVTLFEPPSPVRAQVVGSEMRACASTELANAQSQLLPVVAKIAESSVSMPAGSQAADPFGLRTPELSENEASRIAHGSFPSWFPDFTANYCSMLRYTYMDTVDHPMGVVYTVAVGESTSHVLQELQQAETSTLKPLLSANPSVSPEMFKMVLLLADAATGATDATIDEQRRAIAIKFCPHGVCRVIKLDSRERQSGTVPMVKGSVWTEHNDYLGYRVDAIQRAVSAKADGGSSEAAGIFASPARSPRVPQQFFNDLMAATDSALRAFVVTYLPKRLKDLREYIEQNRQSFTDRLASFFGKKDTRPQREAFQYRDQGDPLYWHHSLEMSLRHAADLSIMLRDYEGATYYYKLCRDELDGKMKERPWNHNLLAGAVEGIGIAQVISNRHPLPFDPAARTETKLEVARDLYAKGEVFSHSFKTALLLVSLCRIRSQPANDKARRVLQMTLASRAPPLYRAMQLDQLAQCYIMLDPPFPGQLGHPEGVLMGISNPSIRQVQSGFSATCSPRKYAVNSLLAALSYGSPDVVPTQHEHALRCALLAWAVLKHRAVRTYPELVRAAQRSLARSFRQLGMLPQALEKVVEHCRLMGSADASDYQFLRSVLTAHLQVDDTEWAPTSAAADSPSAPTSRAASPIAGVPVVSPDSMRLTRSPFAADILTVSEEDVLGVPAGQQEVYDAGFVERRAVQAWDNTLDELRRAVAAARLSMPRSINHFALSACVDAATSRKLLREYQSDPVVALRSARDVTVPRGASAELTFVVTNPLVGETLTLTHVRLLSAVDVAPGSKSIPVNQLDCSTHTLPNDEPVVVEPMSSREVSVPINSAVAGSKYTVVGVQWRLDELTCNTFFAACPSYPNTDVDDTYTAKSLGIQTHGVDVAHPNHVSVAIIDELPTVTLAFDPPLPAAARDGEVCQSNFVITNTSDTAPADNVSVLFNPCCYHLLHVSDELPDGVSRKLHKQKCRVFTMTRRLAAKESVRIPFVYRGEGGWSVGPASSARPKKGVAPGPASAMNTIMALASWTPAMASDISHGQRAALPVLLGKLLRKVRVNRSLGISSVVLPPTSSELPVTIGVSLENAARTLRNAGDRRTKSVAPPIPGRKAQSEKKDQINENAIKVLRITSVSQGFNMFALGANAVFGESAQLLPGGVVSVSACATYSGVTSTVSSPLMPLSADGDDPLALLMRQLLTERVEQHCVTLSNTLGNSDAAAEAEATVGSTVARSAWITHFAMTAPTAGALAPDCEPPTDDGLAFYSDGGDQENKEAIAAREAKEAAARAALAAERERCRSLSPVLLCVAWRTQSLVDDGKSLADVTPRQHYGFVFHAVDAAALQKVSMMRRAQFVPAPSRAFKCAAESLPVTTDQASVAITAEGLHDIEGCFALEPSYGATTASMDFTVVATNLSVERVRVRVSVDPVFGTAIAAHAPFAFVGATTRIVVIEPRSVGRVVFRPVFYAPGTYNLSCVQVVAKTVATSVSPKAHLVSLNVTGTDQPWLVNVRARSRAAADVQHESPVRTRPAVPRRTIPMASEDLCAAADAMLGAASPLRVRRRRGGAAAPGSGTRGKSLSSSPLTRMMDATEATELEPTPIRTGAAAVPVGTVLQEQPKFDEGDAHMVATVSASELDNLNQLDARHTLPADEEAGEPEPTAPLDGDASIAASSPVAQDAAGAAVAESPSSDENTGSPTDGGEEPAKDMPVDEDAVADAVAGKSDDASSGREEETPEKHVDPAMNLTDPVPSPLPSSPRATADNDEAAVAVEQRDENPVTPDREGSDDKVPETAATTKRPAHHSDEVKGMFDSSPEEEDSPQVDEQVSPDAAVAAAAAPAQQAAPDAVPNASVPRFPDEAEDADEDSVPAFNHQAGRAGSTGNDHNPLAEPGVAPKKNMFESSSSSSASSSHDAVRPAVSKEASPAARRPAAAAGDDDSSSTSSSSSSSSSSPQQAPASPLMQPLTHAQSNMDW